ncbi:MAG TPA: hypothetical protein VEY88_11230 [Archangium sp.]|nr:hypothetical protein [Archangium sp.]
MKVSVIKAGGSGNILETDHKHAIPWLAYRRFKLDPDYLRKLVEGVLAAVQANNKIVFVSGGMGAYLYIDLARELGLSESALAEIGCGIVNVNGRIASDAVSLRGVSVCPRLIPPSPSLSENLKQYDVVVVRAEPGYLSTDALAAVAAANIPGSELVLFKKGVPEYHVGFERPTVVEKFTIAELRAIAAKFGEGAGANSILDAQCLEVIERNAIRTRLVNSDHLGDLYQVLQGSGGGMSFAQTLIEN